MVGLPREQLLLSKVTGTDRIRVGICAAMGSDAASADRVACSNDLYPRPCLVPFTGGPRKIHFMIGSKQEWFWGFPAILLRPNDYFQKGGSHVRLGTVRNETNAGELGISS